MPSVFLSHSSKDKPFARRLAATLRARGIKVWLDEAEILPGDSLIEKLESAIDSVDHLGVILSTNSVASPWVLKELRIALQREISDKKIVVIPCLIETCDIPPFLQDKIYADFRDPERYDEAIASVIARINRGFADESSEALKLLDEIPLTKLWRSALASRSFSERFATAITELLARLEPGENWRPDIAASYLYFLKVIREQAVSDPRLWDILLSVVEDTRIIVWLRYETIARSLIVFKPNIGTSSDRLNRLFLETKHGDLRNEILRRLLDPEKVVPDEATVEFLNEVWPVLYRTARIAFVQELLNFVAGEVDDTTAINKFLIGQTEALNSHDAFSELHALWRRSRSQNQEDRYRRAVDEAVHKLSIAPKGKEARVELLELHRTASRLQEQNDFRLTVYLTQAMSEERLKIAHELQGQGLILGLLTDITKDPEVEVVLSSLALIELLQLGGRESLFLDDDLVPSMLRPKAQGSRVSVVEALCETFMVDDGLSGIALGAVYSTMNDAERSEVIRIISQKPSNKKLELLKGYLEGQVTYKSLIKRLSAAAEAPRRGSGPRSRD